MNNLIVDLCVSMALIIGGSSFSPTPIGDYRTEEVAAMDCLHNLEYKKSIEHFEKAARLAEIQNCPTVERVGIYGTLGDLYYEVKDNAQAELNYKRAVATAESDTTCSEYNGIAASALATFLMDQHRFAESEKYARETIEQFSRSLGPHDGEVASARSTLGFIYYKLGKQSQAIEQYKEALPDLVKSCGENSIEATIIHVALGDSYVALKQKGNARAAYRAAMLGLNKQPYAKSPLTREVALKLKSVR